MKRVIIVTGASSGMGVCFAQQLAKESADFALSSKENDHALASDELWLVARREDRLSEVKQKIILEAEEFVLYEGDSVYDVLVRAAKDKKIRLDLRGSYVSGIEDYYELQYGSLSGWIYHVNGKEAKYGCAEYYPSDGDEILWLYTLELGRDLL